MMEFYEVIPRVVGYGFWICVLLFAVIIPITSSLTSSKKDEVHVIYKNKVKYLEKRSKYGGWYQYKADERDPEEPYSEEELAAMPVTQRIRARRAGCPEGLKPHFGREGECVRCHSDRYEITGPYKHLLCRNCVNDLRTSELASRVLKLDSEGIRGMSKVFLWMSLEELADQVRRHLISEEEAKKETQELYEAAREATRRRESEEFESAQRSKPKSRQEEINDIAKRLM